LHAPLVRVRSRLDLLCERGLACPHAREGRLAKGRGRGASAAWRSVAGFPLQAAPAPGRIRSAVSKRRPDPYLRARDYGVCGRTGIATAPDARDSGAAAGSRANAFRSDAARKLPQICPINCARIGMRAHSVRVTVRHVLGQQSGVTSDLRMAGARSSRLKRQRQGQGHQEEAEPNSDERHCVTHHPLEPASTKSSAT
jgi:hypothetical protein